MANEKSMTTLLLTGHKEMKKEHYVYDGSSRVTHIFQAKRDAANGSPCLVTKYAYIGATFNVSDSREYQGTWDATWDVDET
jgi:predicted lipase